MRSTLRFFLRAAALAVLAAACTADWLSAPAAPQPGSLTPLMNGAAASAPLLIITEFMSDPSRVADAQGEWFEVFNGGEEAVDLQGYWIFSGPNNATPERHQIVASIVVPAGGIVVLGNNTNQAANGGAPVAYAFPGTAGQVGAITLNNSNTDWLSLRAPNGATVIDYVSYSERDANGNLVAGGKTFMPSAGTSRVLVDAAADNSLVAGSGNWIASTAIYGLGDRGTPGMGDYDVVPPGPVVAVDVSPSPATVTTNGTRQLTATGRDENGRASPTTFTWSSGNTSIATVHETTGLVSGLIEGTATITATAANGITGQTQLTVQLPTPASLTLSVNFPDTLPVGYTKPVFPTVRDASGAIITPTPELTWSSGDEGVLKVVAPGYIHAVGLGRTTVTATVTANGVTNSLRDPFTVIPADAPTSAVYRDHLAFGTPSDVDASDDHVMTRRQFALSYNRARGGPNWVSWNINATQFGDARRCDCFSADASLPTGFYHVVDFDYRNGGFDRGHMVQSESRTTTNQENAATFLLTNILPQAADNNQGPWLDFENHLNDLARLNGKEVYVVAGGIYGANPSTLKNEGKVAIPTWTWKVAIVMAGGKGRADVSSLADLEVIAVKLPNEASPGVPVTGIRDNPWEGYKTTVDEIESATGYDLLAALPDQVEIAVESKTKPPIAATDGPYTSLEHEAVAMRAAGSSDPDGDALTYEWTFGDGARASGFAVSHTYSRGGVYGVQLTVTDTRGLVTTAATTVAVLTPVQAIQDAIALVDDLVAARRLERGEGKRLDNMLELAVKQVGKDNDIPAVNQLEHVLNRIDALVRSGSLRAADAEPLQKLVTRTIQSISS
jgi:DNA/RNA endonuclease G (NUC1)/uncharacterized protein YjdB